MSDPKPSIVKALTPGYVGGSKMKNDEPVANNFFSPDYDHDAAHTHDYGYPPVSRESNAGGSANPASGESAHGGDSHGSGCGCGCIIA